MGKPTILAVDAVPRVRGAVCELRVVLPINGAVSDRRDHPSFPD